MFFLVKRAGGIVKLPKQIDLTALVTADEEDCFNASAVAKMLQINKQTFLNNLRASKTPYLQLVPKGQILIKAKDLRRLLKFDHADARAAVEKSTVNRQKIIEDANRAFDNLTPAQKDTLRNLAKPAVKRENPTDFVGVVDFIASPTAAAAREKANEALRKAGEKRWRKDAPKIKGYGSKDHGGGDAKD